MIQMPLTRESQAALTPSAAAPPQRHQSVTFGPLDAIRLLRSAGGALFAQVALHGQLVRVEWAEEKTRLLRMAGIAVAAIICLLCTLLFVGALVLAIAWDTTYRVPAATGLIVFYGLATTIAWLRLRTLSALGSEAFASTREEFAADLALLKSKL